MLKRRNNKSLYDSIMKDVSKQVKRHLNESNVSNTIPQDFYKIMFNHLSYRQLDINEILSKRNILAKIAGYIVEERIKDIMKYLFSHNGSFGEGVVLDTDEQGMPRYADGGNNWWDFTLDGEKVEIKAFQRGKMYSNVKATANQRDFKDQLTFMLVEYDISDGFIDITGIALVDGSDLKFDAKYDRIIKNNNINFVRSEDFDEDEY